MISLLPILAASPALAGDDMLTPRGLSMGGAMVAAPDDNGAAFVNPATSALVKRVDATAHVGFIDQTEIAGTVLDSLTSPISLGVGFRRLIFDPAYSDEDLPGWIVAGELPTNRKRFTEVQLGLSYPVADQAFSMGIGGTIANFATDRDGNGWVGNVDVGVAGLPTQWFSYGVVARNLIPLSSTRDFPFGVLGGVRFGDPEIGGIELDGGVVLDEGLTPDLRAGGELFIDVIAVRSGIAWSDDAAFTAGFGVLNEAGGFNYGVSFPFAGGPTMQQVGIVLIMQGRP